MSELSLFKPLEWAGNTLQNRMVLAPMTRGRAGSDRIPNKIMGDQYVQRADAGLIITEATAISEEGIGWVDTPGIYTEEMVEGWRSINERVHEAGGKIILQLWHTGRASHSDFHNGDLPFSASAIAIEGDEIHTPKGKKPYEVPRAMTQDDIRRTVADFKHAAVNAKAAGFDGIEVHAANGYLLNQFLDSRSNQRSDEYGGSVDNRYRFLSEVMDAVLEIWPSEQVGVRLSPNGVFNDMGADDFRDTFTYVAQALNKLDLGYLHVMDGLAFGFHERGEPMTLAEFRALFDGMLMGNCGYTQEEAEKRISDGDADMIAFGRPWITNPDLPTRFKNNYPLAAFDDPSTWYGGGEEGYTDYNTYREESGKAAMESLT
ncbi:alkene reductase [Alteromonas naphthalenivorans]|jgi:N-ethylmaleimide reductase|uniref:Xenobiotic reductase B n=1 Tax=Alteromonas naphthalenivorans TaxID=715451 RepID=F5Z9M8_ALTNA|nr:alkene reductase [Alteromonas naphthalenivorans]AEF01873.1 xenobiotic reductase B [Alteromonas naphthalenivorans]|tara:strand:- start:182 stop:1303 length:1122 start_codon:yes stop_codon:yes gene_type:complete